MRPEEALEDELVRSSLCVALRRATTDLGAVLNGGTLAAPRGSGRGVALAPPRARWLLWQLLRGLERAHASGLVHRNIKPQQLLLTARHPAPPPPPPPCPAAAGSGGGGGGGPGGGLEGLEGEGGGVEVLQVAGFSHALALERGGVTEPRHGTDAGTLWYRPPESLLGVAEVTCGADLWAAGCVWCEMLTGQALFGGFSTEVSAVSTASPPRPPPPPPPPTCAPGPAVRAACCKSPPSPPQALLILARLCHLLAAARHPPSLLPRRRRRRRRR